MSIRIFESPDLSGLSFEPLNNTGVNAGVVAQPDPGFESVSRLGRLGNSILDSVGGLISKNLSARFDPDMDDRDTPNSTAGDTDTSSKALKFVSDNKLVIAGVAAIAAIYFVMR